MKDPYAIEYIELALKSKRKHKNNYLIIIIYSLQINEKARKKNFDLFCTNIIFVWLRVLFHFALSKCYTFKGLLFFCIQISEVTFRKCKSEMGEKKYTHFFINDFIKLICCIKMK